MTDEPTPADQEAADTNDNHRFDSKRFLARLTSRPGVYRMLAANGDILYVGKAKNLKNRVSSYFRSTALEGKTMALVARIQDVEITITRSDDTMKR